jgi:uncharacterized RDD family membrane protein YckC
VRRRIAGIAYESLLLLGVLSVTFMLPYVALGYAFHVTAPGWFLLVHVLVVLGAYFLWYWHHGGQTLAMQTWKMQLVRADGAPPSLPQLVLRFALTWAIPLLMMLIMRELLTYIPRDVPHWYPVLGGCVGLLWALFDRDRQFLHDRLAGTQIIFKPE